MIDFQFASGAPSVVDAGEHSGIRYEISNPHSTTSLLKVYLDAGQTIRGVPGCMAATSDNINIQGKLKRTVKAMLGPDTARHQTMTAEKVPGWVLIAPGFLGTINAIPLDGNEVLIGDDAFVACTEGIETTSKSQGFRKAVWSGDGMFVKKAKGKGILFVGAVGSMITFDLKEGETVVVDNGHLVMWPNHMKYDIVKASKGLFSTALSGEGAVAKLTGPGLVYAQTRNAEAIAEWIYDTKTPA